ncbi:MAG TPA: phosphatidylglycerol lysyltransferase domain-containing protein [Acidobacteriota bacterium]|nr:phosphatidylglycerol lysyltransferase domain-containing protein [Acidobacteriota bacterium]
MSDISFLGFEFSDLKLDDCEFLSGFLKRYPQPLTGYTFSTLAAWRPYFHYKWVMPEPETLLISCVLDPDPHPHLMQPIGLVSPGLATRLIKAASEVDYALKIIGVCKRFLEENPVFSQAFAFHEDRAVSNYLYSSAALAKLSGRKYAKKRNLLAQASSLYSWTVQTLSSSNTDLCFQVLDSISWEERPQMEGMMARELAALECTLRHFGEFDQQGLLISANDRPVAFSIYEEINPTTVAVHFERALRSYKGLFQVVNCETAKVVSNQGFEYINREEDLGDEGLRDAKMSYHPIEIIPAYELVSKP